MYITNDGLEFC